MRQIDRRNLLLLGLGAAGVGAGPVHAAPRSVTFQVWRNGAQIGTHRVALSMQGEALTASITAGMRVKLGPIPLFTYHHEATEVWAGDRFRSLTSHSVSNGRVETVEAWATDKGVLIVHNGSAGPPAPVDGAPLTHWNRDALKRPLFNPQTGALIHCSVRGGGAETVRYADGHTALATMFAITGDADITDWYDDAGAWAALRAKGPDGSIIEYRRI